MKLRHIFIILILSSFLILGVVTLAIRWLNHKGEQPMPGETALAPAIDVFQELGVDHEQQEEAPGGLEGLSVLSDEDQALHVEEEEGSIEESLATLPFPAASVLPVDYRLDLSAMVLDPQTGRYVIPVDGGVFIHLTLNADMQEHLQEVMARYEEPAQAVVVIEPESGRVLSWVDRRSRDYREHIEPPLSSGEVYAASLFKIVTAAALLNEPGFDPDRVTCVPRSRSSVQLDDLTPSSRRDTQCVDLVGAMANSVNGYFARAYDRLLVGDDLLQWSDRLGFNAVIPFELDVPQSNVVIPDDRLERARMSAGFRHSYISPLHASLIVAGIANGGEMMLPTLIGSVVDANGEELYHHQPSVWRSFSAELAESLSASMVETTLSGTGRRYFSERPGWPEHIEVFGKTGTLSNRQNTGETDQPFLIYSWFAGFSAHEMGKLAVAGLVYSTESWYIKGSYLASEAILKYDRHRVTAEENSPSEETLP